MTDEVELDEAPETLFAVDDTIDLESDAPASEPASAAPVREIAAWLFARRIEEDVDDVLVAIKDGQRRLVTLIEGIKELKPELQAAVSTVYPRPYGLTNESWLYVLNQVRARLESERLAQEMAPRLARQELEPFLDAELKAKLRNRLPNVVTARDLYGPEAQDPKNILGHSICIKTLVRVAMSVTMGLDPVGAAKAEADAFEAGFRDLATKLKAVDEKFEILGSFVHCVRVPQSVTDLSNPTYLAIYPVVRCKDPKEVKDVFDFVDLKAVSPMHPSKPTGSARFAGDLGTGIRPKD